MNDLKVLNNFFEKISYTPIKSFKNVYKVQHKYNKNKKYVQLKFFSTNILNSEDVKNFINVMNSNFKIPYSLHFIYDEFKYDLAAIKDYWTFLSFWLTGFI